MQELQALTRFWAQCVLTGILLWFSFSQSSTADCVDYGDAGLPTIEMQERISRIFPVEFDGNIDAVRDFEDIWNEFTIIDGLARRDPIIQIALAFRALDLGVPLRALASLDRADMILVTSEVCEKDFIHFFAATARLHLDRKYIEPLMKSVEVEGDLWGGAFHNSTRGYRGPAVSLTFDQYELVRCQFMTLGEESLSTLSIELSPSCRNNWNSR